MPLNLGSLPLRIWATPATTIRLMPLSTCQTAPWSLPGASTAPRPQEWPRYSSMAPPPQRPAPSFACQSTAPPCVQSPVSPAIFSISLWMPLITSTLQPEPMGCFASMPVPIPSLARTSRASLFTAWTPQRTDMPPSSSPIASPTPTIPPAAVPSSFSTHPSPKSTGSAANFRIPSTSPLMPPPQRFSPSGSPTGKPGSPTSVPTPPSMSPVSRPILTCTGRPVFPTQNGKRTTGKPTPGWMQPAPFPIPAT